MSSGRIAIEWLKREHLAKRRFDDGYAILHGLQKAFPGRFDRCSIGQTSEWEHQARLELAKAKVHAIPPVWPNGWLRTTEPTIDEHHRAQVARAQLKVTQLRNWNLISVAAAAQPYARPADHRLAALTGAMLALAEQALAELLTA